MNNEQLRKIRNTLQWQVNKQYDDIEEPESTLDLMEMSQDLGEAHQARRLLEMLPEPENETVVKFRSFARIWDAVDDHGVKRKLHKEMSELEEQSMNIIESRIEVEQDGQDLTLKDPVTKLRFNQMLTGTGEEIDTEVLIRHFAEDILFMGVDR